MSHALVIRDERFPCRESLPPWALVKLAKASQGGDQLSMAGMYDFVMGLLLPEEHERFDAYMVASDVGLDELNQAIGALMTGYTGRPTERPLPSPPGPSPSAGGSRVVSLSRPVATQKPSLTGGAQEAG